MAPSAPAKYFTFTAEELLALLTYFGWHQSMHSPSPSPPPSSPSPTPDQEILLHRIQEFIAESSTTNDQLGDPTSVWLSLFF